MERTRITEKAMLPRIALVVLAAILVPTGLGAEQEDYDYVTFGEFVRSCKADDMATLPRAFLYGTCLGYLEALRDAHVMEMLRLVPPEQREFCFGGHTTTPDLIRVIRRYAEERDAAQPEPSLSVLQKTEAITNSSRAWVGVSVQVMLGKEGLTGCE